MSELLVRVADIRYQEQSPGFRPHTTIVLGIGQATGVDQLPFGKLGVVLRQLRTGLNCKGPCPYFCKESEPTCAGACMITQPVGSSQYRDDYQALAYAAFYPGSRAEGDKIPRHAGCHSLLSGSESLTLPGIPPDVYVVPELLQLRNVPTQVLFNIVLGQAGKVDITEWESEEDIVYAYGNALAEQIGCSACTIKKPRTRGQISANGLAETGKTSEVGCFGSEARRFMTGVCFSCFLYGFSHKEDLPGPVQMPCTALLENGFDFEIPVMDPKS